MAESPTTFEIERRRVTRYFRVRWVLPLAVVFSFLALSTFPAADGDVFHPAVLASLGVLAVVVMLTFIIAALHANSLKYWIDGTTLRINEGIVVRRFKSIPLDRVTDIQMVQGPVMRVCGIWSLQVQTAGGAQQAPEGTIWGDCNPESVRDTIMAIRDKAALRTDPGA